MSDLMIYGEIGRDVSARSVVDEIRNAAPGNLNVRINTPGGSVFEGNSIATHLAERGNVTAFVDGLCASMGTRIFLSANHRVMAPGTWFMIHEPTAGVYGTAADMQKEASVLIGMEDEMAQFYSEKSGKITVEEAREMMAEETWLSPEQCLALGFCDEISGKAKAFAKLTERTMYRKAPKGVRMTAHESTEKPGLFDRIMSRVKPGADVVAKLEALQGEHDQAIVALADAAAKVTALESEKVALTTAHATEIEAMKAEHIKALEDAKIQGAQEFAAKGLMDNSPAPLPHVEIADESSMSHSAKWQALYDEKKFSEAAEYRKAHLKEIQEGR